MAGKEIFRRADLVSLEAIRIDPEERFFALAGLSESRVEGLSVEIAAGGLLEPLLVQSRNGSEPLRLVHGFSRYAAAVRAGLRDFPALVFPADTDPVELFRLRLAGHAGQLSAAGAARLIQKLEGLPGVGEKQLEKFLTLLSLGGSPRVLEELRSIARLEAPVARWCEESHVGLSEAAQIATFPREGQRGLLVLFRAVNPSGNLLRRYLALVREISLREARPVETVLEDSQIRRVLLDPQTARSSGRELVHRRLRELRYPELAGLEARFDESVRELGLGGRVKVEPPETFEGERLRVSFDIGSPQELKAVTDSLTRAAENPSLKELFRCLGAPEQPDGPPAAGE